MKKSYKALKRYREISRVLIKYGFVFLVEKLNIEGVAYNMPFAPSKNIQDMSTGERIKGALEELGPTFIKLGQILSTRSDLIDSAIIEELQKLQDSAISFTFEEAKNIFCEEVKLDIGEVFEDFNEEHIACGSIGQVYEGILKNGERVIVKIQRPNIESIVRSDLEILKTLAGIIDEHYNETSMKCEELVEEFALILIRELDFKFEGRNCEKFKDLFKKSKDVIIPDVYWEFTSKKVLILEYIDGLKLTDMEGMNNNSIDPKKIANICTTSFMKQVFFYGLFHADPHPGNIFVINKDVISYIDFGMVGIIDNYTLEFITQMLFASSNKDVDRIINLLLEFDYIKRNCNYKKLREELSFFIYYYYNMPIKNINVGDLLNDFIRFSKNNDLKLPSSLITLLKALITLEGCTKVLDPDLCIPNIIKKFMSDYYINKLNAKNIFFEGKGYLDDFGRDIKNMPRHIRNILRNLEKNDIKFSIDKINSTNLEKEISNMTYTISMSLILSSIIMGSSFVINSSVGYQIRGYSILGIIGFVIASLLGFLLVIRMFLSDRKNKK